MTVRTSHKNGNQIDEVLTASLKKCGILAFKPCSANSIPVPTYLSTSSTRRENPPQGESGSSGNGPHVSVWFARGSEGFQVVVLVKKSGIKEPSVASCRSCMTRSANGIQLIKVKTYHCGALHNRIISKRCNSIQEQS
jgi:hypothetical protein